MSLPIDRTNKAALDTNLVNGLTSDAPKLKANNDTLYNSFDELFGYAAGLVQSNKLSAMGIINVKDYNASGSAQTTTGSITTGTKTLVVASAIDFAVNQGISIAGAGAAGATLITSITAISGTTLTIAVNASTTVSSSVVSHNDKASIQAALNALVAGGSLIVPGGNYLITTALTSALNGITIYGPGTLVMGANNMYVLVLSGDDNHIIGLNITNPNNYTATTLPSAPLSGGLFIKGNRAVIRDCSIDNVCQGIILGDIGGATQEYQVIGNRVTNIIGQGTEFTNDGIISHTPRATIIGNYVTCKTGTVARLGIGCDGNGILCHFTDNIIEGPFKRSIHLENAAGSIASDNRCLGAVAWGITCDSYGIITDNYIEMPTVERPIYPDFPNGPQVGIYLFGGSHNLVKGNKIKSGGIITDSHGINPTAGTHNVIIGNEIFGAVDSIKYGINCKSTFAIIADNIIQKDIVTQDGIVATGQFSKIDNNYVGGANASNIKIQATDCTVSNNTIDGGATGINAISSDNSIISGNRMVVTGDGIFLNAGAGYRVFGNITTGGGASVTKFGVATGFTFTEVVL